MTLSTNDIHAILVEVIRKEIQKKQSILQREEEKNKRELDRLEGIYLKILAFEEKHLKELTEIYPTYLRDHKYSPFSHFLSLPLNKLRQEVELYEDPERCTGQYRNQIDPEEERYFYGTRDSVLISYADFHRATNLNVNSVKKYLREMILIGLIQQIRVIGGYEYKILGGSNNG